MRRGALPEAFLAAGRKASESVVLDLETRDARLVLVGEDGVPVLVGPDAAGKPRV